VREHIPGTKNFTQRELSEEEALALRSRNCVFDLGARVLVDGKADKIAFPALFLRGYAQAPIYVDPSSTETPSDEVLAINTDYTSLSLRTSVYRLLPSESEVSSELVYQSATSSNMVAGDYVLELPSFGPGEVAALNSTGEFILRVEIEATVLKDNAILYLDSVDAALDGNFTVDAVAQQSTELNVTRTETL
jgi:hypothetical protein